MSLRVCVASLVCAVALAACGSSTQTTRRRAPARTVTRTVTRAPGTPSSATPASGGPTTPTTTVSSQSAGAECVASGLALTFLGGQGATGHGELGFALRNTGSGSCRTGGYPGVQFLDGAGQDLPTTPQHTTDDFFGHTTLRELTLAPGASASFRLGVSHVGTGGSDRGCVTARGLQVIPPNDTHTLRITVAGVAECGGTVTVSPLQPGTSALR
jgi:hypothetical protein